MNVFGHDGAGVTGVVAFLDRLAEALGDDGDVFLGEREYGVRLGVIVEKTAGPREREAMEFLCTFVSRDSSARGTPAFPDRASEQSHTPRTGQQ
jgi:hypothetical protein